MRRARRTCRRLLLLALLPAWYEAIAVQSGKDTGENAQRHGHTRREGSANHRGCSLRRRRFSISRCFSWAAPAIVRTTAQLLLKSSMGSNSTRTLLSANELLQMVAALARSSFRPRCRWLLTVATGASKVAAISPASCPPGSGERVPRAAVRQGRSSCSNRAPSGDVRSSAGAP